MRTTSTLLLPQAKTGPRFHKFIPTTHSLASCLIGTEESSLQNLSGRPETLVFATLWNLDMNGYQEVNGKQIFEILIGMSLFSLRSFFIVLICKTL